MNEHAAGVCCLLLTLSAVAVPSPTGDILKRVKNETSTLSPCIIRIVEALEGDIIKMSIFGSANDEGLATDVAKGTDVPLVIDSWEHPVPEGLESGIRNDLILIVSDGEVPDRLNETLWHSSTRFLVVSENDSDVEGVFRGFWRRKVVNVFALVPSSEEVIIYGYLPYEVRACDDVTVVVIDRWSGGDFAGGGLNEILDDMRIKNMNGCRVNVTVVDVKPNVFFEDDCSCNGSLRIGGIEGNLMAEIGRELNMEAMYLISVDGLGWGWIHPEPQGVVGEVFTGRSEFGIGLLAPIMERYENLDLSVTFTSEECITYGVPKGAKAKQPTWIMILVFEFPWVTWALIAAVFGVSSLGFWFINKILRLSMFYNNFDLTLYLLGSCLGLPVRLPSSITLRTVVISWITFTFVITVAYKASMGSKLTVPVPDPDINTFEELLESDLELNGYNNMLRLMQYNDSDPDIRLMEERFVVTDFDIDYAVHALANRKRMAHVRHSSTFLYYILIYPEAMGHINIMEDCIYEFLPIFVMRKNSPFTKKVNQVMARLNEGGVIMHWRSAYIYSKPPLVTDFIRLSLEHTFGMFFLLLLGYSLSLTAFIGEILYDKCFSAKMNDKETEGKVLYWKMYK